MKVLKTNNGFYVHALRGVCFVTWVSEEDKKEALLIPDEKAELLQEYIMQAKKLDTEIVEAYVR